MSKKLNLVEVAAAVGGTYVGAKPQVLKDSIVSLLMKHGFKVDTAGEFNYKLPVAKDALIGIDFRTGIVRLMYFYDQKSNPTEGEFEVRRNKFNEEILLAIIDYVTKMSRVRLPAVLKSLAR